LRTIVLQKLAYRLGEEAPRAKHHLAPEVRRHQLLLVPILAVLEQITDRPRHIAGRLAVRIEPLAAARLAPEVSNLPGSERPGCEEEQMEMEPSSPPFKDGEVVEGKLGLPGTIPETAQEAMETTLTRCVWQARRIAPSSLDAPDP
jgi:hypothetical protein